MSLAQTALSNDLAANPIYETSVDASEVIRLIRELLPNGSSSASPISAWETAGCTLWDLSSNPPVATWMVCDGCILEVIDNSIQLALSWDEVEHKSSSYTGTVCGTQLSLNIRWRVLEVCLGILANLVTLDDIAERVVKSENLMDLICHDLLALPLTPMLIQLCRLASVALRKKGAGSWVRQLATATNLQLLLWMVDNTLDAELHLRCWDLIVALMHAQHVEEGDAFALAADVDTSAAGAAGAEQSGPPGAVPQVAAGLVELGLMDSIRATLVAAIKQGTASENNYDIEMQEVDDGLDEAQAITVQVSEEAVDAVLRAVEELLAGPDTLAATVACPTLHALLVQLMHASDSPQVLESLVLLMMEMSSCMAPLLASELLHMTRLADVMSEMSAQQHTVRDTIWYLLAFALQQWALRPHPAPSAASPQDAGSSSSSSSTGPHQDLEQKLDLVLDLADKTLLLPLTSGSLQYARTAIMTMTAVLESWQEGRKAQGLGGPEMSGGDSEADIEQVLARMHAKVQVLESMMLSQLAEAHE